MSIERYIVIVNEYFVVQSYPYGEPSGMFRLVVGIGQREDGKPELVLADDLFSFSQAFNMAEGFKRIGVKSVINEWKESFRRLEQAQ